MYPSSSGPTSLFLFRSYLDPPWIQAMQGTWEGWGEVQELIDLTLRCADYRGKLIYWHNKIDSFMKEYQELFVPKDLLWIQQCCFERVGVVLYSVYSVVQHGISTVTKVHYIFITWRFTILVREFQYGGRKKAKKAKETRNFVTKQWRCRSSKFRYTYFFFYTFFFQDLNENLLSDACLKCFDPFHLVNLGL